MLNIGIINEKGKVVDKMVDKIVEFNNGSKYVMLEDTKINNKIYYLGLKLDKKEEPTSTYLLFEEFKDGNQVFLNPVFDEKIKNLLLPVFTIDYFNMSYGDLD